MLNSWKPEAGNSTTSSSARNLEPEPAAKPNLTASKPAKSSIVGEATKSQSIVDECLTMRGDLESEANILVKGKVLGNISCHSLVVDSNAVVEGGIDAKEVIVRGKVEGVIRADRVRLDETADVECDIYQKTFAAEEGARIRGSLKNLEDAPKAEDKKEESKKQDAKKDETKKPTSGKAKIENGSAAKSAATASPANA